MANLSNTSMNTAIAALIHVLPHFLAHEITTTVHGKDEADKARAAAKALFGGGGGDISSMPTSKISLDELRKGISAVDFLSRKDGFPHQS